MKIIIKKQHSMYLVQNDLTFSNINLLIVKNEKQISYWNEKWLFLLITAFPICFKLTRYVTLRLVSHEQFIWGRVDF